MSVSCKYGHVIDGLSKHYQHMGSYAYWHETHELTRHFKLYSQKSQQSIKTKEPSLMIKR